MNDTAYQCEYDGTTDGMNLMIDRCGLNRDNFQVFNIDPDSGATNKWTGHIMVHQFTRSNEEKHQLCGVYLKPGDYYIYRPKVTDE